jgi:hypothetical protein
MSNKNQNYIVEYNGEPVTRLSFEGQKANVTTGDIMDAIWYTAEEAAECAAAIGTGAEKKKAGREQVNEIPCVQAHCPGLLRWPEAGYLPGYRVCDCCGHHYAFDARRPTVRGGN